MFKFLQINLNLLSLRLPLSPSLSFSISISLNSSNNLWVTHKFIIRHNPLLRVQLLVLVVMHMSLPILLVLKYTLLSLWLLHLLLNIKVWHQVLLWCYRMVLLRFQMKLSSSRSGAHSHCRVSLGIAVTILKQAFGSLVYMKKGSTIYFPVIVILQHLCGVCISYRDNKHSGLVSYFSI